MQMPCIRPPVAYILYMIPHVTATALQHNGGQALLGRLMRIACLGDFASPTNPGGIALPVPRRLLPTNTEVPTYGEQAIEPGVLYRFGGCSDGRTLVFVNETTGVPLQIFCCELLGAVFVLDPDSSAAAIDRPR